MKAAVVTDFRAPLEIQIVNATTVDPVAAILSVDRKLDDINQAMADVPAGQVPARIVFQF